MTPPRLLECPDLQLLLENQQVTVIDLSAPAAYASGHIPGAIFVSPSELIHGQPPATGAMASLEKLKNLFERIGYTEDQHYVAVDDEGGGWAGRFLWTLEMIGHNRWSYLDGGMIAWKNEGYPLSTEIPKPQPTNPNIQLNETNRASLDEVRAHLEDPEYLFWDSRSREEYQGLRSGSLRAGHIPGARHCEWTSLMNSQDSLKIRSDAAARILQCGIQQDKTIVTYCQTHHRSGFTWLVGKILGFHQIKAYDGSWSEWGNRSDTPIEP